MLPVNKFGLKAQQVMACYDELAVIPLSERNLHGHAYHVVSSRSCWLDSVRIVMLPTEQTAILPKIKIWHFFENLTLLSLTC
jgi:hypothetical protein